MTYSNLTISFHKGRKGMIIGKIVEQPHITVRGTSLNEVREHIAALVSAAALPSRPAA